MRAYLRDEEERPGPEEEREDVKRREESSDRQMYMPSWHMEELLSSLAVKLRTSGQRETRYMPGAAMAIPAAFTLFVLNPRPAWVLPRERQIVGGPKVTYGYRCGLSSGALAALAADQDVLQRVEKVEQMERKRWRIVHTPGSLDGVEDGHDFQDVRYVYAWLIALRKWAQCCTSVP